MKVIKITQHILDVIKKRKSFFEFDMPTIGEEWVVEEIIEYPYFNEPAVELRRSDGKWMRLLLSDVVVEDNGIEDKQPISAKEQWISETAVKLLSEIPCEYVCSGVGGQTMEARHIYAARIAKEMADVIFGE